MKPIIPPSNEGELLHSLNRIAASLQQAIYSEEEVYATFRTRIPETGLRGGISILDDKREILTFKAVAQPKRIAKMISRWEKIANLKSEGFSVEINKMETYRQVISTGQAVFTERSNEITRQLVYENVPILAKTVEKLLPGSPAIYAPLRREGTAFGMLNLAGPTLRPEDIPVIQAFANQVAIALVNAELFSSLKESEASFRALLETSPDAVTVTDFDGNVVEVSKNTRRLLGYEDSKDLIGKDAFSFVSPEDQDRARQIINLSLKNPIIQGIELTFVRSDETHFQGEVSAALVTDASGAPKAIIATIQDITERQRAERELIAQKDFNEGIVQNMTEITVMTDENGYATFLNPAAVSILGYTPEELIGRHWTSFLPPDQNPIVEQADERRKKGQSDRYTLRLYHKDGSLRDMLVSGSPLYSDGIFTGTLAVFTDITEQKRTEEALQRQAHHQQELLEMARNLNESLDLTDVLTRIASRARELLETHGCAIYMLAEDGKTLNPVIAIDPPYEEEILSTPLDIDSSITGKAIKAKHGLIVNDTTQINFGQHIPGTPEVDYECIIAAPFIVDDRVHGAMCLNRLAIPFTKEELAMAEMFASYASTALKNAKVYDELQREIEQRKRIEMKLLHDALHDDLTGLPNRSLFNDRLWHAIERSIRNEMFKFAVLFMDLDRFKLVNDSLGHTRGDQLLCIIAQRLQLCIRSIDTLARLGGDEFVILLEEAQDITSATSVAQRIQEKLAKPFSVDVHKVFTSASIGIVLSEFGYETPEQVMRDADIALYHAKAAGRDRYVVFDTQMRDQSMARLDLETDLRRANFSQEFCNFYQPILSTHTNQVVGFEVLGRWLHPVNGKLLPKEYIPVCEETGLIISMGRYSLMDACRWIKKAQANHPSDPPLYISINLSEKQFNHPDLIDLIKTALKETHLDASAIKVEITESVMMANTEQAVATIEKLRQLGIGIDLDDFGTGHSSLSKLMLYKLDHIKIDHQFISAIESEDNHWGIIRTIVELTHELGMKAVAEGVETRNQLDYIRKLNCDYWQGFLYSEAVDGEAALKLLAKEVNL